MTEPSNLPIKRVVIHVTDSPDDKDFRAADINRWHLARGWSGGIGYHLVICRDATIERGRPEATIGAHAFGYNAHSLGVVWVGRNRIEQDQYQRLVDVAACLLTKHNLTTDALYGHTELDPHKTCPNLPMDKFRADVAEQLAQNDLGVVERSCDRVGAVCDCADARAKARPGSGTL